MTCEEFRHQLSIDPYRGAAAFQDHVHDCPACARAAEEALRFEETLRAALAADLSTAEESDPRRLRPPRILYTLLFLPPLMAVLWLTLHVGLGTNGDGDPSADVIEHMLSEEEHLQAEGTVPWAHVRRLFGTLGADADPGLGPVRFAGRCLIGKRYGIHLILPGERGSVTALFLPGNDMAEKREFVGGGLEGTLVPAGSGSLAVVGEPGEPLESVIRRLRVAVRWNESDVIRIQAHRPEASPR
jgi:hypothetical protein